MNGRIDNIGSESSRERKFHRTFVLGSESSRERKGPGAKVPGNERAQERKFQGANWPCDPIGTFAPGSELAWERKGQVPLASPVAVCIDVDTHGWPG